MRWDNSCKKWSIIAKTLSRIYFGEKKKESEISNCHLSIPCMFQEKPYKIALDNCGLTLVASCYCNTFLLYLH
jgi:hypothetical protein